MQIRVLLLLVAAVRAIPLATSGDVTDADEAVAYPAQVDQSWVDTTRRSVDADEAVAYPAQVDQSWVDSDA
ncbi:hypothetical protein TSTA_052910 [Talaromyces stipitatus ATCC 10500]|uniref:Uncharacterized protein n=1 Tax=Talaromyces stipitatus (strain ATCC 10500 / CBS 375.48 / QM 6759 / NRRL 1006) TaxID=441959 RepID=B8MQT5_TALSN|nr:uncharacterized protein TSTA_052910 [Talaromyces stipitatus ATCC 10500]EED12770.1 hypothetical protein TSTA_052910 [Talaromyces stipitatus ATCC 10500]